MLTLRVFAGGGLGNKLFQICFAHFLNKSFPERSVQVTNYYSDTSALHSQFNLSEIFSHCSHVTYRDKYYRGPFPKVWSGFYRKNPFNFGRKILDYEDQPCKSDLSLENLCKFHDFFGYFQNKEYFNVVKLEMIDDLRIILKKINLPSMLEQKNLEVIHIRRGDTLNEDNRKRIGVLDKEYYNRILKGNSNVNRIILTNDREEASKISYDWKIDEIYDSEKLDVFQTLKVMSNANHLIAANSTLSWWGGVIAKENGGIVTIPKPFYRDQELDCVNSFNIDGFHEVDSIFLD